MVDNSVIKPSRPPTPERLPTVPANLERITHAAEYARGVVDRLPGTGVIVVDDRLHLVLVRGALYADCDADAAIGRPVSELVAAGSWATLGPRYRGALRGRSQAFEHRADGRVWAVRMSAITDLPAGSPVTGVLVLIQELTGRVRAEERLRASERLQRAILGVLSEGVIALGLDGEILQANVAARAILHHPLVPGRDAGWWGTFDARDLDGVPLALRSPGENMLSTGEEIREVPVSVRRGDGARRTLCLNYGLLRDDDGATDGLVISFRDVTEQHEAHARLVATQSELRDAHDLAQLSSWEWSLDDDRVRVLQSLRGRDHDAHETDIDALLAPVPPEDRERIALGIERLRAGCDEEFLQYRYQLREGSLSHVETRMRAVRNPAGMLTSVRGTTQDVTARVQSDARLRSAHGHLRAVTDSMAQGMCTLDLDGRALYINQAGQDLLGWPADELIGKVFHEITGLRRADGTPYPIDECPIMRTRPDGEPVRSADEVFIRSDGTEVPVEYSAAPFETPDGERGTVLLFADSSERKEREARIKHDLEDLAWVARINEAIERDLLVLHAQPIIDLATGATVQHELLIRMLGADGETIPPGAFLPAAERYGLIRDIDRWVVRRGAQLSAAGHSVEINISAESLGDADFAVDVERELREARADCSNIVLELTETALLRDEDAAARFIARVQRLGCGLALDDFGTGYGGFTYLKRMKVDFLKIDVEFVRDLPSNTASQHVVRAVVNLAADFGHRTVAEGVEDGETLELLRELGVDYAQGYHTGRPMPLEEALGPAAAHFAAPGRGR